MKPATTGGGEMRTGSDAMTRDHRPRLRSVAFACLVVAACLSLARTPAQATQAGGDDEFYDAHFHLTNYVQEGIDVRRFLEIMGRRVGRSTLFGIPLQQQWSYAN